MENNSTITLNSAELYDPSTESWTADGNMKYALPSFTISESTNEKMSLIGEANDVLFK